MRTPERTRTIAFYSYKGGTGRSFAMAHAACGGDAMIGGFGERADAEVGCHFRRGEMLGF